MIKVSFSCPTFKLFSSFVCFLFSKLKGISKIFVLKLKTPPIKMFYDAKYSACHLLFVASPEILFSLIFCVIVSPSFWYFPISRSLF